MNIKNIKSAFKEISKINGIEYSIVYPEKYGDCNTWVLDTLCDCFGETANGIYLRYWKRNGDIKNIDELSIAHDVNVEQYYEIIKILNKYFKVTPEEYDEKKAILISK